MLLLWLHGRELLNIDLDLLLAVLRPGVNGNGLNAQALNGFTNRLTLCNAMNFKMEMLNSAQCCK